MIMHARGTLWIRQIILKCNLIGSSLYPSKYTCTQQIKDIDSKYQISTFILNLEIRISSDIWQLTTIRLQYTCTLSFVSFQSNKQKDQAGTLTL